MFLIFWYFLITEIFSGPIIKYLRTPLPLLILILLILIANFYLTILYFFSCSLLFMQILILELLLYLLTMILLNRRLIHLHFRSWIGFCDGRVTFRILMRLLRFLVTINPSITVHLSGCALSGIKVTFGWLYSIILLIIPCQLLLISLPIFPEITIRKTPLMYLYLPSIGNLFLCLILQGRSIFKYTGSIYRVTWRLGMCLLSIT